MDKSHTVEYIARFSTSLYEKAKNRASLLGVGGRRKASPTFSPCPCRSLLAPKRACLYSTARCMRGI